MNGIKNLIIDIDGVLLLGDSRIDGAGEAIDHLEKNKIPYVLVTNVTRMPKQALVEKLARSGIKVNETRVLTALSATIEYIKSRKENAKCFVILPDESDLDFKGTGLSITRKEEPADFVVLGYDRSINFEILDSAFRLVKGGAELVAMHEDKVFPGKQQPSIGLGAFVRSIEYSTDKRATVVGKPNRKFFNLSLRMISANAGETAMVGDSLLEDIIGAKNAGLKTIMVKTGNFSEEELYKSKIKPDYLIESIRDLPNLLS